MTNPVQERKLAHDLWWLDIPAVAGPKGDVAADFGAVRDSLGYVPNVMLAGANLPGPFLAMRALYRSIMTDPAPLTPAERELIALVVSAENRCDLCVIGHSSMLRGLTGDPHNVGIIEVNYRRARLSTRERALADFAVQVTRSAADMVPSSLDLLRAAGLTEQEILAAAHVAAYYNMSNRLMSALGVKSQPEAFHAHRQKDAPRRGQAT